jgi:hypothetical protein
MWLVEALVVACGCGRVTGGGNSRKAANAKARATLGNPTRRRRAARAMSRGRCRIRGHSLAETRMVAGRLATRWP